MAETSNMISHNAYPCEGSDTVYTAYECRQYIPASITTIPLTTILPTVVSWINDARTYIERSTDPPWHRPLEQRLDKMGCLGCGESFVVALETCTHASYRIVTKELGSSRRVPCSCAVTLLYSALSLLHRTTASHLPCSLFNTQAWVAKHIATWRLRLQARRTRNWPPGQSASRSHTSIAIASVSSPTMGSTESKACWQSYTMVVSLVKITSGSPCGMLLT